MKYATYLTKLSFVILVTFSSGCSIITSCKDIGSRFCLEKWEDNDLFYLNDKLNYDQYGSGKIGGPVINIGWDSNYILAERKSSFRGEPGGWMIVDKEGGIVSGPYDRSAPLLLEKLSNIKVKSSSQAWSELRY